MKFAGCRTAALAGVFFAVCGCGEDEGLVARKTMDPRAFAHANWELMGRNYWTIMTAEPYSVPGWELNKPYHNPAIKESFLFRDCAIYNYGGRGIPDEGKYGAVTWRTVRENYTSAEAKDDAQWKKWDPVPELKPGKPILCVCASKRNFLAMSGKIDLDYADYAAFTNTHPTVYAWSMFAEFDNDSRMHYGRIKQMPEGPKKAQLAKEWGTDVATNRYARMKQLRQYFDRKAALYWDDVGRGMSERSAYSLEHVMAAWGVGIVSVETTGTTESSDYRWDVMGMFCRGAARQFDKPWEWYIALHSCGYTKDLKTWSFSGANWNAKQPSFSSPNGGLSRSLMNRIHYYAYVNGANFVQPEGRTSFTTYETKPGLEEFTDRGRDFERYHQFTHDHPDRGATFAHCAILTPFEQGYPGFGGRAMNICPYEPFDNMVDGVFFTLVPAPKLNHKELAKIGVESNNLHNTSFAMSYDVLVPNSPQPRDDFLKALNRYPVAYLSGLYRAEDDIATPLREYVERGGTLVLNATYLSRFPQGWAGVAWDGGTTFVEKGVAKDERGKSFDSEGDYDVAAFTLAGAKPFLTNAAGRPLMTVASRGKGRVIATAPLYMAPRWNGRKGYSVADDAEFGRASFAYNRYLFARLQDELFPVRVAGDCQYGINRTKTGWWLWMLNNRGVRKWIDVAETLDPSAVSPVTVDFGRLDVKSVSELVENERVACTARGFAYALPPGSVRIFELK